MSKRKSRGGKTRRVDPPGALYFLPRVSRRLVDPGESERVDRVKMQSRLIQATLRGKV